MGRSGWGNIMQTNGTDKPASKEQLADLAADLAGMGRVDIMDMLTALIADNPPGQFRDLLSDWRLYLTLLPDQTTARARWEALLERRPAWAGWAGRGLPPDQRGTNG